MDELTQIGVEHRPCRGTDVRVERRLVSMDLVDEEAIGRIGFAIDVEDEIARLGTNGVSEFGDQPLDVEPTPRNGRELCVERDHSARGWQAHAGCAPVMMATASVIEWECGVIVAARFPRRWMWMRSATSNTFGML